MRYLTIFVLLSTLFRNGLSIWCYRCVGSHPGCGLYDFDWRYYWSYQCPDPYDKCVKVIEQKGAEELMVTRVPENLGPQRGHPRPTARGLSSLPRTPAGPKSSRPSRKSITEGNTTTT
ncbi:uncharacterized protein LOC119574955 isoform X2 [Penaeus monodon]|uniref:uncharacterized protein LOC119574955 isoform X1 n=1 Tax=Penaeus monodon TaxID=6687 RepID=UPI0018A6F446|nr:uncharacterized protein LOC119574955 isoform X1 [Penaeus monodon]XP_037778172.1 uncharacterized protein LOC119574955 isoform X2 [Penaeus monodon]